MGPVPTVSGEPAKAPRVGWAGGTRDVTHAVRSLSLYLRPACGAMGNMKTEGPFMKRDVKGSVTGPTSVSMSLTLRHEPSTLLTHAVRLSCLPSLA